MHVLTNAEGSPKQMVRNVESALLAQLGLKVDHRKISIAQTAEVRPLEALEQSAVRDDALKRQVVFKKLEVEPAEEHRVRVRVTLVVSGEEESAEEEVGDTTKARMLGAARAAVAVLDRTIEGGTLELEGVKLVDEFDSKLVMVGVHTIDGREAHLVLGTAEVRRSAEGAAVLAVLDATNRWVQSRS